MADAPGQAVAELLTVDLDQDAPALVGVVEVAEHVQRLDEAAELDELSIDIPNWPGLLPHLEMLPSATV